jgi:hypothetical protein
MADIEITGRTKVKTLKNKFKKEFGSTLRIYNGIKFADDNATIGSIASKTVSNDADVKARGNTKVGTFIAKCKKHFGLKVRVADKTDKTLIPDDIKLSDTGEY